MREGQKTTTNLPDFVLLKGESIMPIDAVGEVQRRWGFTQGVKDQIVWEFPIGLEFLDADACSHMVGLSLSVLGDLVDEMTLRGGGVCDISVPC